MKLFLEQYFRDLVAALAFAMVVASWFFLKRLPGWIRALRAEGWPTTEGRIETTAVKSFGEQALAELGYSYVVEGERYSGYYSQQFADEQCAWDYLKTLQGQSVVVRFERPRPEVSVLRTADQQSFVNLRGSGFLSSVWTA